MVIHSMVAATPFDHRSFSVGGNAVIPQRRYALTHNFEPLTLNPQPLTLNP
jgi:hypothetical protein